MGINFYLQGWRPGCWHLGKMDHRRTQATGMDFPAFHHCKHRIEVSVEDGRRRSYSRFSYADGAAVQAKALQDQQRAFPGNHSGVCFNRRILF